MSSLKANTITDRVGTGAPNFTNGLTASSLTVNKGSLGTTAGNTLTVSDFTHNNGNVSYLRLKATRSTSGTSWTTASTKLLQVIDVTEMGYIEFNPNGSNFGIALGQGGSEHMRLLSNGNVGIGLTNPTSKLDVVGDINTTGVLKLNSLFNRVIQVGVNTTLQNRDFCEVVGAGVSITLPSGPSNGNEVRIGVGTFTNIRVFASNNIMGINDDFLIDIQNTNISFIFIGGTVGWRIF